MKKSVNKNWKMLFMKYVGIPIIMLLLVFVGHVSYVPVLIAGMIFHIIF